MLKRRFDSVELVLMVGTGEAMVQLNNEFDMRPGDILIGDVLHESEYENREVRISRTGELVGTPGSCEA